MRDKQRHSWLIALAGLAMLAGPAGACSKAVFDYALARWQAEPYVMTVFHAGKLQPQDKAFIDEIEQAGVLGANIEVLPVDVNADMTDEDAVLWKEFQGKIFDKTNSDGSRSAKDSPVKTLPFVVLDTPVGRLPTKHVWSGELKDFPKDAAVKSSVRTQIVAQIAAGGSAVWVVLESGDKAKDDAAKALLYRQLSKMEKELTLPADPAQFENQAATAPTQEPIAERPRFPIIRLSRTDPGEQMFIHMLPGAGSQDAGEGAPEPMAFVVFGRGRCVGPLVGKQIDDNTISEVCTMLAGDCTCILKDARPGLQLLMTADWDAVLDSRRTGAPTSAPVLGLPEPKGTPADARQTSLAAPDPPGKFLTESPSPEPPGQRGDLSKMGRNLAILAICGGAILTAATAVVLLRRGKTR